MVNEELVENIRSRFQQGQRRSEIRETLVEEGWEEADIEDAISYIQNDAFRQLPGISHVYQFIEHLEQNTNHTSPKVIISVLAGCFGVLLLIFGGLYYFLDPLGFGGLERDKQREADIVKLRNAIDTYQSEKSLYPTELKELVPKYIQAVPLDPETGAQYPYKPLDNKSDYELCVSFESKAPQCIGSTLERSDIPQAIATPTAMPAELLPAPEKDITQPEDLEEAPIVTLEPEVPDESGAL